MPKSTEPEIISLTPEEIEGLKKRITEQRLTESDQKIMLSILSLYFLAANSISSRPVNDFAFEKDFWFANGEK